MQNFKSLNQSERISALSQLGQPAFREKQIFQWIIKGAASFDEMHNLPKNLIASLKENYEFTSLKPVKKQISSDGTIKFLLQLPDANCVEAVFMEYSYGNSLCISTQVGCNMGCSFCASAIGGKVRNLRAWEMLDEFLVCRRETGKDINHIVLMGIGEPLDNYGEVSEFFQLIHNPSGVNLSYRNITLSTCGLIPAIEKLGDEYPQVNLAVSLHASSQQERLAIMPVARAYPLADLIKACKVHAEKTGRRITFEYALMAGKNDSLEKAKQLANLLSGMLCHVNLIPLNPVTETGLVGSSRKAAEEFRAHLESLGIPATVRRSLGQDIDAACGQLRNKSK